MFFSESDPAQPVVQFKRWVLFIFAIGLLLQFFLSERSWIGGDQINLLRLGWSFAETGELLPFAKAKAGAGAIPGVFQQLLVGLPLRIIPHYQSPLIFIAIFHVVAGFLVLRVVRQGLGEQLALIFFFLYWLSPWRLYHSAFLWEPQYMFLPAAVHLWACYHQRQGGRFVHSVVLAASLILAMQIHNSFFLLVLLTGILLFRKQLRLHWPGIVLGSLIGSVTLLPSVLAIISGNMPPVSESSGFLGAGLVKVAPTLKGAWYWIRLGSLDIGNPYAEIVFFRSEHTQLWSQILLRTLQALSFLTVLVGIRASWWFFGLSLQRFRRKQKARDAQISTPNTSANLYKDNWFRPYCSSTFFALVGSAALAPITLQGWQVIVAFHAACVPVAAWLLYVKEARPKSFQVLLPTLFVLQLLLTLLIGFGNPIFRRTESLPQKLELEENLPLRDIVPSSYSYDP